MYVKVNKSEFPREKWLNYLQTVEENDKTPYSAASDLELQVSQVRIGELQTKMG